MNNRGIAFKFQIRHKSNYNLRTVTIYERDEFRAKQELYRCFPNYNYVKQCKQMNRTRKTKSKTIKDLSEEYYEHGRLLLKLLCEGDKLIHIRKDFNGRIQELKEKCVVHIYPTVKSINNVVEINYRTGTVHYNNQIFVVSIDTRLFRDIQKDSDFLNIVKEYYKDGCI